MSSPPEAITWLDTALLVRVETTGVGWPLADDDDDARARLLELPWRLLQVDHAGLRGVLEADDDDAVARLGALTSAIEHLATVEVRDDVAIAMVEATTAVRRSIVAGAIGTALAGLDARPLGVFVDGLAVAVAFERWRREALATVLRTVTSLSR